MSENAKAYGCSRYREGCKFTIWKVVAGKRLTARQVQALLTRGSTERIKGFKSKAGKPFAARLKLDIEFKVVFDDNGVKVIIDSTFATPVNQRPLEDGADLVLHSATKYLGGHNDLLAGTITGRTQLIEPIRKALGVLGGIIDSHGAWLLLRGLKTLELRMERHNQNGLALARFLDTHPKVRQVWYPGLASHPDHAVALRQMQGFGGVVTFTLRNADRDRTWAFIDALKVFATASSLGSAESLVAPVELYLGMDLSEPERKAAGITEAKVRLACGIEHVDDLVADLAQAFEKTFA